MLAGRDVNPFLKGGFFGRTAPIKTSSGHEREVERQQEPDRGSDLPIDGLGALKRGKLPVAPGVNTHPDRASLGCTLPGVRVASVEFRPDFFKETVHGFDALTFISATELRPDHHQVHSQDISIAGDPVCDFVHAPNDDPLFNGRAHGLGDDLGCLGLRTLCVLAVLRV